MIHRKLTREVMHLAFSGIRSRRRKQEFDAFRNNGLAFIHVPRCAGTSISHEVFGQFINHYTLSEHERLFDKEMRALPIFTVVRNPWDRLVSCWTMAKAGRGREGDVTVNPRDSRPVQGHDTFESFVLEGLPAMRDPMDSILFAPQVGFVVSHTGNLRVAHTGRFEDLEPTQDWIGRRTGRSITFPKRNSSVRSDYRSYYNPAMVDAVREHYRADVELFGYEFDGVAGG
jgi:hypothetical protein